MIEFVGYLETPLSPDVVFALLADMAQLDRWNPNVTASRRSSGEQFGLGSTYVSTIQRGPVRMTARSELTAVEPGRSVTYQGTIAGFWSIDSLAFEPNGDGTRVVFRNESQPPRWLRFLSPLFNAAFQPQAHRAVDGARRYLEASPHDR